MKLELVNNVMIISQNLQFKFDSLHLPPSTSLIIFIEHSSISKQLQQLSPSLLLNSTKQKMTINHIKN